MDEVEKIAQAIEALPELEATKSRDYGRGYAACAKDAAEVLRQGAPEIADGYAQQIGAMMPGLSEEGASPVWLAGVGWAVLFLKGEAGHP